MSGEIAARNEQWPRATLLSETEVEESPLAGTFRASDHARVVGAALSVSPRRASLSRAHCARATMRRYRYFCRVSDFRLPFRLSPRQWPTNFKSIRERTPTAFEKHPARVEASCSRRTSEFSCNAHSSRADRPSSSLARLAYAVLRSENVRKSNSAILKLFRASCECRVRHL